VSARTYFAVECDGCMDEPTIWPTRAEARLAIRLDYNYTHHRDGTDHCPRCEAEHRATGVPPDPLADRPER
jgi:hypothetical protein